MNEHDPAADLARAQRLATASRRAGGWYARYLVVFGIASFLLAASFAVLEPLTAALVITPIWLVALLGFTLHALRRRKASVHGHATIHGLVMLFWGMTWAFTMTLSRTQPGPLWPLLGGAVLALIAFAGAYVVHQRSSA